MKSALSWANLDISAGVVRNVWCWLWCWPLSSIVWANFLASGWFVHCYFLSCYFFSYLPTVSFSLLLLSYCYPDWINGTITYFPNTCILTWPLLLSFLFLFFLSLYSYCYPNELLPFFLFLFFPLVHCYFLSCYFFSYLKLLLSFLFPFFPLVHCYFLSCYFFSCYFFSYLNISVAYRYRKSISIIELFVSIYIGFLATNF